MYFDAGFWRYFFKDSFARQIEDFGAVFAGRILPVFDNAEKEAEDAAEREFQRLGELPAWDDGPDMADAADQAHEAGLAHYEMLTGTRQAILNLAVAALYHMFEQQLMVFHRRQVLHPSEEHDPKLATRIEVLKERLDAVGVNLESLETWPTIHELKLASNAIKHGEGSAAKLLRSVRPQLFTPPTLHGTRWVEPLGTVSQPLIGEDIYVTTSDLQRYRDALVAFWNDFGAAISASEESR